MFKFLAKFIKIIGLRIIGIQFFSEIFKAVKAIITCYFKNFI